VSSHLSVPEAVVERAAAWFGTLTPVSLEHIGDWYGADARFKDPFQEVQGLAAVRAIYAHMFESLVEPQFLIRQCIHQGGQTVLVWDFQFGVRWRSKVIPQTIHGATHLTWAHDGLGWRIQDHRDYWDTAEELYEKWPLLGAVLRFLKRRLATPQGHSAQN
jgi:hypothetical protein